MIKKFIGRGLLSLIMLAASLGTSAQTSQKYYYVKAPCDLVSGSDADGSSWEKATSLADALGRASAGSVIFVKGYAIEQVKDNTYYYTVPDRDGFMLWSGVRLYGGFAGTEQGLEALVSTFDTAADKVRPTKGDLSQMVLRSVLTGDVLHNDTVSTSSLIYPDNGTRDDNARHVVTMSLSPESGHANDNNEPTILNGFFIAGGHAVGSTRLATSEGYGGGVYVTASTSDLRQKERRYDISRCYITDNYANLGGGGVYVDGKVTTPADVLSNIRYSTIYNNVAGERNVDFNYGGGLWIEGRAHVANNLVYCNTGGMRLSPDAVVTANTISRNTSAAVDALDDASASKLTVSNSAIWANERLSKLSMPNFQYCGVYNNDNATYSSDFWSAFHNVQLYNHNTSVYGASYFTSPAPLTQYDHSFDFHADEYPSWSYSIDALSSLIGTGSADAYDATLLGSLSLDGHQRTIVDETDGTLRLDIGAYSYERIDASRRRYVKPKSEGGFDGTDDAGVRHDGTSWDKAYANPQTAIDDLAATPGLMGEVYVKGGVYTPTRQDAYGDYTFTMHDGISVYGGFRGTETSLSERGYHADASGNIIAPTYDAAYPWRFEESCVTTFRARLFNPASVQWSAESNMWSYLSDSRHVVWLAPQLGSADFHNTTILDGVTIEGGLINTELSASQYPDADLSTYSLYSGAGVYMRGTNTRLQNCVVRYCNTTIDNSGKGGAVYNHGGRVEHCLLYNNIAASGGGAYVDGSGLVSRCVVSNNIANDGGGVYLRCPDGSMPSHQILSMSVVSNNLNYHNGAVYTDHGGTLIHNTIVNNYTSRTTDDASGDKASRTGGLYVNTYGQIVNNILWNNQLSQPVAYAAVNVNTVSQAQMYVSNASTDRVCFYNNAMSSPNYAVWNKVLQSGTYEMSTDDITAYFEPATSGLFSTSDDLQGIVGMQSSWKDITYFWNLAEGSSLRRQGLPIWLYPDQVLLHPDADIEGKPLADYPTIGAHHAEATQFKFACLRNPDIQDATILRLYVDPTGTLANGDGASWGTNAPSLQEAINKFATLAEGDVLAATDLQLEHPADFATTKQVTVDASKMSFEVCVREGSVYPKYSYDANDPSSVSVRLPKTVCQLTIRGGYPSSTKKLRPTDADRSPMTYRTELDGDYSVGTAEDNAHHVARVEEGADVVFSGISFVNGYAGETAAIQRGGGVLIYDGAKVRFDGCVLERNYALGGAAVAATSVAAKVDISFQGTVIANNTVLTPSTRVDVDHWIVDAEPTSLHFDHVSIVNNIGWAPSADVLNADGKTTSFAAGNMFDGDLSLANNTLSIATLGADGAQNFSNPSVECGATATAQSYYGGYTVYRPLTSSMAMDVVINKATPQPTDATGHDIAGNDRNLGGLADLGAYEALLPRAGSVVYVRAYNTVCPQDNATKLDETDGSPNFNLLLDDPSMVYNGQSWDNAIMGNAMCDTLRMDATDNSFYVVDAKGRLLATTFDNADYSTYLGETTTPKRSEPYYGPASGHYTRFITQDWQSGYMSSTAGKEVWDKYYQGNANQWDWNGVGPGNKVNYMSICNERKERYVSGLQLAVEIAAKYNALHRSDADFREKTVWVAAGVYTDFKGFVIRNGVKVYGGFPKTGTPGENDRKPLLSQYIPAREADQAKVKSDYETILQIRKESPVYRTTNSDELWYSDGTTNGSTNTIAQELILACEKDQGLSQRHYVLYQPDVCVPTWNVVGDVNKTRYQANQYRIFDKGEVDSQKQSLYWKDYIYGDHPSRYVEYSGVKWDGFTIRHGYTINYMANRDGGGGVRVFRGVDLENLVIVNNLVHGKRTRGGGLYMDGENSVISNSFIINNLACDDHSLITAGWCDGIASTNNKGNNQFSNGEKDDYGGGAYMIVGTGYNMVVANNRAVGTKNRGGGIFIENAKFYNNTVCYNMTDQQGPGIEQWANKGGVTGIDSELSLYNCIVYGNKSRYYSKRPQVSTLSPTTFKPAHNCLLFGQDNSGTAGGVVDDNGNLLNSSFYSEDNGNIVFSYDQQDANNPFAAGSQAHVLNDYRLKSGSLCLNGGTDDLNQNGESYHATLPATDMDYTDRVKDCVVDIGAYEHDEYSNIDYELRSDSIVYYVTQNGYGDRSGRNPDNAACAEKLQKVLNHAGEQFQKMMQGDAKLAAVANFVVKVAGYPEDELFVYHANTLADATDPQSYTYLIPDGVTLMGGFYEGMQQTVNDTIKSTTGGTTIRKRTVVRGYNWYDDHRNSFDEWTNPATGATRSYRTILSAEAQLPVTSTVDEVVGYHAVTFGSWPKGNLDEWAQTALSSRAIIDGCFIIDGNATETTGHKAMGGGAIVPANALVRNCVVYGNKATLGGGLYLMPGAVVSGTLIQQNTAKNGAAIYADNGPDAANMGNAGSRVYLLSSTITANTASASGGGIYMENGALMASNCVLWGNEAPSDRNICGVIDQRYEEDMLYGAVLGSTDSDTPGTPTYYPFNDCYVETYRVPANTTNTLMTSDGEQYFSSETSFVPRPFSPLVHNGTRYAYMQNLWMPMGVAEYDMRGVPFIKRNSVERLTEGAFAVHTPLPSDLFTRLFVSNNGGAKVSDDVQDRYVGRTFVTPFNSLDLALEYIRQMRSNIPEGHGKPLADKDTHFEILMTGGDYKPGLSRQWLDEGMVATDRRMCTFSVPENTSIYGGFLDTDNYSCGVAQLEDAEEKVHRFRPDMAMTAILAERNDSLRFTDFNGNNIREPWELSSRTILLGDIQNSDDEHVYHVVFAENPSPSDRQSERTKYGIVLDGLDIMNGETRSYINVDEDGNESNDELGHGAGVYSTGVGVTLNRCRLLNNTAVHGGAVAVKNADLTIIGSMLAQNRAVGDELHQGIGGHGGAVLLSYDKDSPYGNFYAVGSIFVNNSAYSSADGLDKGKGGAIYLRTEADNTSHDIRTMNCILARNSAPLQGAMYWEGSNLKQNGKENPYATNSIWWGNYQEKKTEPTDLKILHISHSASDRYKGLPDRKPYFEDVRRDDGVVIHTLVNMNVALNAANDSLDGPRFSKPTTTPGYEGYDVDAKWNPKAVSILTDAGDGKVNPYPAEGADSISGAYYDFWMKTVNDTVRHYYAADYGADRYMFRNTREGWRDYKRYLGGLRADGMFADRVIDIGVYEYQYKYQYDKLAAVYIGMEEMGDGDGRNWANQSSDLRSAIIAMANPKEYSNLRVDTPRSVYVRGGSYFSPTLLDGNAFTLEMNADERKNTTITVKGSCIGETIRDDGGNDIGERQDFSKQTVIVPSKLPILMAGNLLTVRPRMKEVHLEGLTFMNDYGRGVHISTENDAANVGSVTMRNCALVDNLGSGIYVSENKGKLLVYNTLFDHNQCRTDIQNEAGDGANQGNTAALYANGKVTAVNCTFVENRGKALDGGTFVESTVASGGKLSTTTGTDPQWMQKVNVYNSVSWQNGDNASDITYASDGSSTYAEGSIYAEGGPFASDLMKKLGDDTPLRYNKAFAYHYGEGNVPEGCVDGPLNEDNVDGPNFTDPSARDYTLRPSFYLMNRGNNAHYLREVLGDASADIATDAFLPVGEVELGGRTRHIGKYVDIGAYEMAVDLRPIIYVSTKGSDDNDGSSWERAVKDLQAAVDLTSLYSRSTGLPSYVFADAAVTTDELSVIADGVHVYGSMYGETSSCTDDESAAGVGVIVDDLLRQRTGALERAPHGRTSIEHLTLNADAVVDGVQIPRNGSTDGSATVEKGILSTSLLMCDVAGTGDGVLYNSLVYDRRRESKDAAELAEVWQKPMTVSGVRSVNVTSLGTIQNVHANEGGTYAFMPSLKGSYANRALDWKLGVGDAYADGTAIGEADTVQLNRYACMQYRNLQLNDYSPEIDCWHGASVSDDGSRQKPTEQYLAAQTCMAKVLHPYDVLGNRRLRNALDNGCFETWDVWSDSTIVCDDDYPRAPSVVYVHRGVEMDVRAPGVYNKSSKNHNYNYWGFLLLEHHAGVRVKDSWLAVLRLAMERDFKPGKPQLVYVPFVVDEYTDAGRLKAWTYDGLARAAYSYRFDTSGDSPLWTPVARVAGNSGYLMRLADGQASPLTVRFYNKAQGEVYGKEQIFTPDAGTLSVKQYNMMQSWLGSSDEGQRFTHKENMGWNIIGSPFFCSLNYGDWQYGRIVYRLSDDGKFLPVNATDNTLEGHIPPFDAVFTQTSTLSSDNIENVVVERTLGVSGEAYEEPRSMAVAIAPLAVARDADAGACAGMVEADGVDADEFDFDAVPSCEAHADFDVASDGVKWMAAGRPLVYAVSASARYSLLSAVNVDGEVALGVSLPAIGAYRLCVPDVCDASGYEAVWLKDAQTGRSVDLLEGAYEFATAEAGEQNGRFTLSFHKISEGGRVIVSKSGSGRVSVRGLLDGDEVRAYLPNGMIANMARATRENLTMSVPRDGVVIIEVKRGGKLLCVRKLQ